MIRATFKWWLLLHMTNSIMIMYLIGMQMLQLPIVVMQILQLPIVAIATHNLHA